jgi:hypothetical protein
LIEAHTKGLFKLPQPVITTSRQDTNTLNISFGRSHGVIAGVCLSIVSKDGRCHTRYTLREAAIRDDHLCIRPPEVDLCVVNAEDLIVSFIQGVDLGASERALALLLDETLSAATQIKSILVALEHVTPVAMRRDTAVVTPVQPIRRAVSRAAGTVLVCNRRCSPADVR